MRNQRGGAGEEYVCLGLVGRAGLCGGRFVLGVSLAADIEVCIHTHTRKETQISRPSI